MTMNVSASYFDAGDKKIQLRDTFNVECRSSYRIDVLFTSKLQSLSKYNDWVGVLPFYQNVAREGVKYAWV